MYTQRYQQGIAVHYLTTFYCYT